jgi:DNA modification methylase
VNAPTIEARRACPGGHSGSPLSAYTVSDDTQSGTSIFDPVLTELCYRWFCPKGGVILDPFAGGSVRGIVASVLGYDYHGFELRPEQVAANEAQAAAITPGKPPRWYVGDSAQTIPAWGGAADFVFSCPPYGNLEVYSDLADDLSAMPHEVFIEAYAAIIAASVEKLKQDAFACFVVGDFRDKKGFYRNFTGATVEAFEAAGARYYNEAILVTAVGSLPVRVGKQFRSGRKLGKTHQNILVFCKGDPKRAAQAIEGGQ